MIDPRGFDTCPNTARDTRLIPEDFVVLSQDSNVAAGQNSNDADAMEEERATESNDDVEVSDGASQTCEEQAIADGQQATLSGPDPGDPPRSFEEQLDELFDALMPHEADLHAQGQVFRPTILGRDHAEASAAGRPSHVFHV